MLYLHRIYLRILFFNGLVILLIVVNCAKKYHHSAPNSASASEQHLKAITLTKFTANSEWHDLDEALFFRTNTARYLVDKNKLLILFTCSSHTAHSLSAKFKFSLSVELVSGANEMRVNEIHMEHTQLNNFFEDKCANLELSAYLDNSVFPTDFSEYSMRMYIHVASSTRPFESRVTSQAIRVAIKKRSVTRHVHICGHTNFLGEKDYLNHKWWVIFLKYILP